MTRRPKAMNNPKQQQRIDEAARSFVEALLESQRKPVDSLTAQRTNAQLIKAFFDAVIDDLRLRAHTNNGSASQSSSLDAQQRQQLEATQALGRESADSYTDFLNSLFFYRKVVQEIAKDADRQPEATHAEVVPMKGSVDGG